MDAEDQRRFEARLAQLEEQVARLSGRGADAKAGEGLLSIRDLSAVLGVPVRTLEDWQRKRIIPVMIIGRKKLFDRVKVLHALEGHELRGRAA